MIDTGYLGMRLFVSENDRPNLEFFAHCADGALHLQQCAGCGLMRYPPSAGCPFCGCAESRWRPVEAAGTVYSFTEIHHATNPAFRPFLPYAVAIVELDDQRGVPTEGAALRIPGVVAMADGNFASPDVVRKIGINMRMRASYRNVCDGMALLVWTPDEKNGDDRVWRPNHAMGGTEESR